ncbi:MBL fold metallo-hydrolase [Labrys monachus]|uniref:Phosphoribosyl 1,2-cyclic phosphate phosphodiesterase n=1 Tax=Labrys monachus TaxID=217067 RepID=A0ABU0FEB4_9HYPH|nr:MBL fold metallo-hydrolase [Labrys monachus]MDQ0392953.1 phosphoribosyl 1,2-cyclic phosphate phosphodiesterase [Labrys monachus]
MTLTATLLGCGSSGGVPRIGFGWGDCDPAEPRNRRRRCSLLIEREGASGRTTVLIDTGPDMRQQLLDAEVDWVDGVLYTHEHADHTHGIDDLRVLAINRRRRVDVHADPQTAALLRSRFSYCFETPKGSNYPPILTMHTIDIGIETVIDGAGGPVAALPFDQDHGDIHSLGFRVGNFAYSSDINGLPKESEAMLQGLDVWVVDALRPQPHPSHWSLTDALHWIAKLKPKRAILTNMHTDMDYRTLTRTLPPGVEPGFDGMRIGIAE